ncbi:MAG: thioredoxin-disulfide reductase [Candidatus Aenigmarchaeota archaeon]|nr:thioredoxin-disulfide reductase [Candidatus Aenigmarchaeota archaeon]
METYDLIIIGGAAAGLPAALYAARRKINTLVITEDTQGQTGTATTIENYPGFLEISGIELMAKFKEQAKKSGANIVFDNVKKLKKSGDDFEIETTYSKYSAKSVIISAGKSPRTLGVPGEENLKGRGVSYCATCDGPFFKGKKIAVVGGGNTALEEAEYLSKIAEKVYLIHRRSDFRAEEAVVHHIQKIKNIEFVLDSIPKEINGENKVEAIVVENTILEDKKTIPLDGVFVSIGYIPKTDWIKDFVKLDDYGQIIVTKKCETSKKGVFAAGDITNIRDKQTIIAAAQGVTAALSAYDYLVGKKR